MGVKEQTDNLGLVDFDYPARALVDPIAQDYPCRIIYFLSHATHEGDVWAIVGFAKSEWYQRHKLGVVVSRHLFVRVGVSHAEMGGRQIQAGTVPLAQKRRSETCTAVL